MSAQRHRIRRQILEIRVQDAAAAWPLQSEVGRIQKMHLEALIDRCCTEASDPGRLHRIQSLEVDLGRLDPGHLERDLVAALGPALRAALAKRIREDEEEAALTGSDPDVDARLELVAHFARRGHLPWWADASGARILDEPIAWLLERASQVEAFAEDRAGQGVSRVHEGQAIEEEAFGELVPRTQFAPHRQRLFVDIHGLGDIALRADQQAQPIHSGSPGARILPGRRVCHQGFEPMATLGKQAAVPPEPRHFRRHRQGRADVVLALQPVQREAKIGVLEIQSRQPLTLIRPDQFHGGGRGQVLIPARVGDTCRACFAAGGQPLPPELANGLQHREARQPRDVRRIFSPHETLRHQRIQDDQRSIALLCLRIVERRELRLRGIEREASGEDGQAAIGGPLSLVKEVMRPVDGGAKRPVTCWSINRTIRQEGKAAGESEEQRRQGQDARTSGSQFERQGQAIEPAANGRDRAAVLFGQAKCGINRLGSLHEEANPRVFQEGFGRVWLFFLRRDRKRRDGEFALTLQPQW